MWLAQSGWVLFRRGLIFFMNFSTSFFSKETQCVPFSEWGLKFGVVSNLTSIYVFTRKHNFYVQFLLLLIWYIFFILLMQLSNMKIFCFVRGGKVLQEKSYGVGAISGGWIQNKYFWRGRVLPQKEWKEVGLEPSDKLCTSYFSLFVSWL